jgi:hypothetical protein
VIDILLSNHGINFIAAATCTRPGTIAFDQFDAEFDTTVTLVANIVRERKISKNFSMCIGIIQPVNRTTVECREPLDSLASQVTAKIYQFRRGDLERSRTCKHGPSGYQQRAAFNNLSTPLDQHISRGYEWVVIGLVLSRECPGRNESHSEVVSEKLNCLDGPWHDHIKLCSW